MDQIKASFNKIIHAPLRFDNKVLPEQSPFGIAFSTHLDRDELFKYLKDIHKSDTVYNTIQKKIYLVWQKTIQTIKNNTTAQAEKR